MNRKYLDWVLNDWGIAASKRFEGSGYSSSTPVGKMMELGIGASSKDSITPTSNYWPNSLIADINAAISMMDIKEIELFVYKRVLAYTYEQMGKTLGISKGKAWNKMNEAEIKLISIL